ncbi:MAG TPA: winged helix DNA-binding domain-containing protein [Aggregatilineaceae bacterium]|nr:winged helix DNA-binding domain-containing protein [Aggregatilineaceae bacterium]
MLGWQRLYNQYLEGPKFQKADEVVTWLGAVQAQEYALAKWALALRMEGATDVSIEQAFADGAILRTHVMRPTWHFVTPADIRWMLELTAPRVQAMNRTMYRKLELDETLLRRGDEIIGKAVEGGQHRTRAELGAVLAENGIDTTNGMRLGYLVHHAELEGIVCSGARRGKQHTYALIAERAPQSRRLARDEALAELTRRFFTSHGPATVKDFAWWSGLTVADVKAGLTMLGAEMCQEVINGETFWFALPSAQEPPLRGHLLPVYDEYTIAYKKHSAILDPRYAELTTDRFFTSAFAFKGEIIGMWRRTISEKASSKTAIVEIAPFRAFTLVEDRALTQAVERFGAFLQIPVVALSS